MKITIVDYQEEWQQKFLKEKEIITGLLSVLSSLPVIEHIGSTSVPGLGAKPIIDILIGVADYEQLEQTVKPMNKEYTYVKKYNPLWPTRRLYARYNPEHNNPMPVLIDLDDPYPAAQGLTSLANIHTVVKDTEDWVRHLAFRDYLRAFPEIKNQYFILKSEISKREFKDMFDYNDAKNDFIKSTEKDALVWYEEEVNRES